MATVCKGQLISQNVTPGHTQTEPEKHLKTTALSVDLENIATDKSEFNSNAVGMPELKMYRLIDRIFSRCYPPFNF